MATLSLLGQGLKLDTRADIAPHLVNYDPALIEEIHLGGNTIGVEAAQALADFLAKTEKLRIANFADIFTGRLITEIPLALSAICDALIGKSTLVEIDLSDNAFGGRSVDPLVPFLSTARSLRVLKLNNNGLGPAGGAVIAEALTRLAGSLEKGTKSNLRTIICGRNRLEDGSASAWAAALEAHGTLEEVRMPQNGIRMAGISSLVKGLAKNTDLLHLDLQDNTFAEEGGRAFADELGRGSWPLLKVLNLSDCVIGEEGEVSPVVEALAQGLHTKLENLQLQNDNLEAAEFALLAGVVSKLPALKRLEAQWNEVEEDDESVAALAAALRKQGGRLILNDEEDEEEEEVKEAEEEEEAPASVAAAPATVEVDTEKEKSAVDQAADDITRLLEKVSIR
ncbi:RNI-like protein [Dichomitus squalens]|uniref:RNI-like protein n=1 Tax=Dichomitus squalens TaxID=114155 RepID=A0A4Q9PX10_9APHY|nr:RNI-like protein [Dichomitus squalens LYAD-421 SS1]EJF63240.1 RNI-like protein [Dichomitus squalens LYAD-421 SS1]TBU23743.1 RNI-like protein [Dichomitus squalens]TBU44424.1 RNI-like protein [Dichomitus squalens]TBU59242.1 RNI-like protein [Dichomitus squalens]